MSREETTEQQTVTTVRCDFCANDMKWQHPKACANKCGRDVCYSCGTDDPTDFGDYIDRFCPPCWALDQRVVYFAYIETADRRREALQDGWREAARN